MQKERYEGIDGLKAYAILGIALMHVLANGEYELGGFVFEQLIPAFTNLVFPPDSRLRPRHNADLREQ